ncbi:MAG TPA: FtsX-like permease family protein, partial [Acidobacteriota bacterium]
MSVWSVEDVGLRIVERDDSYSIESREIFLKPQLTRKIQQAATRLGASLMPVFTYLANQITAGERTVPYSIVAAVDLPAPPEFSSLQLNDGATAPKLGPDEILLSEWAANDLAIKEGEYVDLSYYAAGSGSALTTRKAKFRVRGISAMKGLAADRHLAPEYPGIQDAERISEWSPPFPIDLNLIRPKDEEYWEQYRATPKAFVSLQSAQQLWGSRFGNLTSLRLEKRRGIEAAFGKELLSSLRPAEAGFVFLPVKEQGLRAAEGSTDFSSLFLGFSIFLIASAVLLAALLFRLAVEQRSNEVGLLLAVGYPLRRVLRRFLREVVVLAAVGCGLGVLLGLAYAWLLLKALQTLWISAIGAPFVTLHVTAFSVS